MGDGLEHDEVVFTLHAFKSIICREHETWYQSWTLRCMFMIFLFLNFVCKLFLNESVPKHLFVWRTAAYSKLHFPEASSTRRLQLQSRKEKYTFTQKPRLGGYLPTGT